jgi:cytochrome c
VDQVEFLNSEVITVRRSYLLFILLLLLIGVLGFAGVFGGREVVYKLPSDQIVGAVLVGGILAVAVLTAIVGGGLAFAFGQLGKQLTVTKPAPPSEPKAEAQPVAPYTPAYSYQSVPDDRETRQWIIGAVIGAVLLTAYVLWRNLGGLLEIAGRFTVGEWIGAIVLVILVVGGTGVVGAGLAFWFFRTQEEQNKVAKAGPMWPVAEVSALEANLRANPPIEIFKRMRFVDKFLVVGNIVLVLLIAGVAAVWVGPGIAEVAQADAVRYATWTPAPTPTQSLAPVASGFPSVEEVTAEFGELPAGNAADGEQIFNVQQPCHTCHVDQPIGPAVAGLADRAGSSKPGYSADLYLYESIAYPGAHIVQGFTDGIMPQNFKDVLSPQQLADLVAYLKTVK